jgi:hypothetical protein
MVSRFPWREGMLPRRHRIDGLAVCWIFLITALLVGNLSNVPLWQDEAESALNALTISSGNLIPKGSADGTTALLHEMALYYKADGPKYEYLPTHFLETPYVTIHGWLPYYFIRLGIGIFGKNEIGPRFFSVIFFGLALAVLYVMIRGIASPVLALCVVGYFSLMSNMLGFSMQARYYSYALFFNLFAVFSFYRFTQSQSRVRFWVLAASEVMLYYTYLSAFYLHQIVFVLFILLTRRDLLRRYVIYAAFVGMFALPHILVTKFPLLALRIPARHSIDAVSLWMFFPLLEWNLLLVLSAIAFFSIFIFRTVKNVLQRTSLEASWDFDLLCFLMVWVGYIFISYTSPKASFYPRVFLYIIPFIIYAAFSRISPGGDSHRDFNKLRIVTFVCIFLLLFVYTFRQGNAANVRDLFTLNFKPNQGQTDDPGWILDALKYIKYTGARKPLILTSFNHFVVAYYTDYKVELIWPLKKEYIDRLTGDFFIIVEKPEVLRERCITFLPEEKNVCDQERTMNFFDRAAKCTSIDFDGVRIFQPLGEWKR